MVSLLLGSFGCPSRPAPPQQHRRLLTHRETRERRRPLMLNLIKNLVRDESGQDLAEYGIALAVIAVGAAIIAVAIGGNVNTLWANAQTAVESAVTAEN